MSRAVDYGDTRQLPLKTWEKLKGDLSLDLEVKRITPARLHFIYKTEQKPAFWVMLDFLAYWNRDNTLDRVEVEMRFHRHQSNADFIVDGAGRCHGSGNVHKRAFNPDHYWTWRNPLNVVDGFAEPITTELIARLHGCLFQTRFVEVNPGYVQACNTCPNQLCCATKEKLWRERPKQPESPF